ncbi:hypothetical protein GOB86_12505 [Acetobacter lambici]|uniref:Uncharacterized protein n=1 Tax=Acetobacter lambici TaxID=1332824 RepID=A0ABT1F3N2_9PROT|nr:hypothetical protein [Acetobacter lambici]MCP1243604.1 hypothetical protein [Acetobacter lambici]MCP1259606.1 hypothetical protein [Acetobacter lambici]NHO57865.1 hypothetical protein [Acetobacter lambici]
MRGTILIQAGKRKTTGDGPTPPPHHTPSPAALGGAAWGRLTVCAAQGGGAEWSQRKAGFT